MPIVQSDVRIVASKPSH